MLLSTADSSRLIYVYKHQPCMCKQSMAIYASIYSKAFQPTIWMQAYGVKLSVHISRRVQQIACSLIRCFVQKAYKRGLRDQSCGLSKDKPPSTAKCFGGQSKMA